ncbi:MAG: hypothetical protein LBH43_03575 [Treponema sp.]|jgi:hypothetical protein|nr:hypothetical protein [Treponema sp.]
MKTWKHCTLAGILAIIALTFVFSSCDINGNDSGKNDGYDNTVPGSNIEAKWAWLEANAKSDTNYTIVMKANESIGPTTLEYYEFDESGEKTSKTNIGINIVSNGAERIISLSSPGSLFIVAEGVTLSLGNNITLQGYYSDDSSLVIVNGNLVMNTGSRITGSSGPGVAVINGNFTMNGGEISGNNSYGVLMGLGAFTMNNGKISGNAGCGAGVVMGSFTMNGGEISNNNSSSASSGGVFVVWGSFTMNGGVISGNTSGTDGSSVYGGGVYVGMGSFTMNSGIISGNTSSGNGKGGGVHVGMGSFTMNGGVISGNATNGIGQGGGVYVAMGRFTMDGGVISGNITSGNGEGGGVYVSVGSTFLIVNGTIYGSNEANTGLRNTAADGEALYAYSSLSSYYAAKAQYGTFSDNIWNSNGELESTSDTIRVVNGILQ